MIDAAVVGLEPCFGVQRSLLLALHATIVGNLLDTIVIASVLALALEPESRKRLAAVFGATLASLLVYTSSLFSVSAFVLFESLRERLSSRDAVFVLSVGGGSLEQNVSANLVRALQLAVEADAAIVGVVGRDGGYTASVADACVIVPTVNPETVTPHCESFQAVVWHLLVSHPKLKARTAKWEGMT